MIIFNGEAFLRRICFNSLGRPNQLSMQEIKSIKIGKEEMKNHLLKIIKLIREFSKVTGYHI